MEAAPAGLEHGEFGLLSAAPDVAALEPWSLIRSLRVSVGPFWTEFWLLGLKAEAASGSKHQPEGREAILQKKENLKRTKKRI